MGISFNRGKNPIDIRNADTELPYLVKLVAQLSGIEDHIVDLRNDFTRDDINSTEIIDRLNLLDKDFAIKLKEEISKVTYDLDNDINDEIFAKLIKDIAEDRKSSKSTDKEFEFKKYVMSLNNDKKKKTKKQPEINIESNDITNFSLDEITNPTLKAQIEENFSIKADSVTDKNNENMVKNIDPTFIKLVDVELESISINLMRLNKQLLSSKGDKKATSDILKQINATNETRETLVDVVKKITTKANVENSGVDPKVLLGLNKLKKTVDEKPLDIKSNNIKNFSASLKKLGEGSTLVGQKLNEAVDTVGHFNKAFQSVGDGTKSFGQTKDLFEDFARILTYIKSPIVAFGAVMALAAKAVGMYHDQLNISREMGDNSGNMISDLQKMHIRTLVDPEQMKKLSDDISVKFNVSLSNNQKELEKTAIKQRLTERVMGKEYAADQVEAISTLKDVMIGSSPTELMDNLASQTTTLAKTMGISNKLALNQIKAIAENTKVLTKGLNKDLAAKIQERFASIENGLVAQGISKTTAQEMSTDVANTLSNKDDISKDLRKTQLLMETNGVGANVMKSLMDKENISSERMYKLYEQASVVGYEGLAEKDKADLEKISFAMRSASSIQRDDYSKKADSGTISKDERSAMQVWTMQQMPAYSSVTNAYNDNKDKFINGFSTGQKQYKEERKGNDNTQDLNKILVAMGATDQKSKDEKVKSLYASSTAAQKVAIDKLMKDNNSTMENAYRNVMSEEIKKSSKDLSEGKSITLSGQTVSEKSAKEIQNLEKDPVELINKTSNLSATSVEIKKDQVETLATNALYSFQNAIMDLVDNINLLIAGGIAFLAAQFLSFGKGPLKTFSMGLGTISSTIGSFMYGVSEKIVKGHWTIISGFAKSIKDFSFKDTMKGLKESISSTWTSITDKVKNFSITSTSKSQSVDGVESNKTFFQNISEGWNGFKESVKGGVKGIGGALKGFMGPAALAGAAVIAFQGALDGWGKAGTWFAKSIEDQGVLTEAEAKKLSKSGQVTKNAAGDYIDSISGEILKREASLSQKMASGVGGALEALSFGLLDGQTMAYKTADAFKWIGTQMDSSGITSTLSEMGDKIKVFFGQLIDIGKVAFNVISPAFNILGQVFKSLIQYVTGIVDIVTGLFTLDFGKVAKGFSGILDGLYDLVSVGLKGILDIVGNLLTLVGLDGLAKFVYDLGNGVKILFDGFSTSVSGLFDMIAAPFQGLKAWFNGEMDLTEAMKLVWDSFTAGFGKLWDGISAPIKALVGWVNKKMQALGLADSDEKNQADEISKKTTDADKKKGDELYKKLDMGSLIGSTSEKDLREKVTKNKLNQQDVEQLIAGGKSTDNEKESLVKILEEMKNGYVKASVDNIANTSTKEDKKAGDELAKKLQMNGNWDTSDELIRKRVDEQKVSNDDIKKLISSNDTSSDEKDSLVNILNERLAKTATPNENKTNVSIVSTAETQPVSTPIIKVEPKEVPAFATGGSTGGMGDVFAKMILPDTSKEQPVATVGTDEFVFNKEMIENQVKLKNATTNNYNGISTMGLSPLPENNKITGDISNMKATEVENKPGFFTSFFNGTEEVGKTTLTNFSEVLTGKGSPTEAVNNVGTSITTVIPESNKMMTRDMSEISQTVTKQFDGMVNGETILSSSISNVGTDINENAVVPMSDALSTFSDSFSSMFSSLVNKVKSTETYKTASKFATDIYEKSKGFMGDIAGFIHKSETGKSEGDYGAAKDIGDGAGISFGAYQMTEKSGGIKSFLDKMAADGDTKAAELSKQFNASGNSFGGNKADLTSYLKEAGVSEKGKAAQDEIYTKKYLEPALRLAEKKGVTDKAAIAQIVDHSVNAGVGGAERMLNKSKGSTADDIANARREDYRSLGNYDKYGKGWNNRIDNNLKAFKSYQGINIGTPDNIGIAASNQSPTLPNNNINAQKPISGLVANTGTSIPLETSTKISANNLVAQNTANQITNNTTNNTVNSNDKNIKALVDLTKQQVAQQQAAVNEATKQTKQFQKDYRSNVDRMDNNRQYNITKNQNSVV